MAFLDLAGWIIAIEKEVVLQSWFVDNQAVNRLRRKTA